MKSIRILLALNLIVMFALAAPPAYAKARELLGAPKVERHSQIKLPKDRVEVDRIQYSDGLDCVAFSKKEGTASSGGGVGVGVSGTCNWDSAGTR